MKAIEIPENTKVKEPVFLEVAGKVKIKVGQGSEVTVIESSGEQARDRKLEVSMVAMENSIVRYVMLQALGKGAVNSVKREVEVKGEASLKLVAAELGSKETRSETVVKLTGKNASVENIALYMGKANQRFELSAVSEHLAEGTRSKILTKGVLEGNSRAMCTGLIKVHPEGTKSDGYQRSDVLLLSENAKADAIPMLEIDNNDVKCSHGATMGEINKEQLFYLMNRGLSEEEAKGEIVRGFLEPVMVNLPKVLRKKVIGDAKV
jgi:Fe-S cluster assembly protein SufD